MSTWPWSCQILLCLNRCSSVTLSFILSSNYTSNLILFHIQASTEWISNRNDQNSFFCFGARESAKLIFHWLLHVNGLVWHQLCLSLSEHYIANTIISLLDGLEQSMCLYNLVQDILLPHESFYLQYNSCLSEPCIGVLYLPMNELSMFACIWRVLRVFIIIYQPALFVLLAFRSRMVVMLVVWGGG